MGNSTLGFGFGFGFGFAYSNQHMIYHFVSRLRVLIKILILSANTKSRAPVLLVCFNDRIQLLMAAIKTPSTYWYSAIVH